MRDRFPFFLAVRMARQMIRGGLPPSSAWSRPAWIEPIQRLVDTSPLHPNLSPIRLLVAMGEGRRDSIIRQNAQRKHLLGCADGDMVDQLLANDLDASDLHLGARMMLEAVDRKSSIGETVMERLRRHKGPMRWYEYARQRNALVRRYCTLVAANTLHREALWDHRAGRPCPTPPGPPLYDPDGGYGYDTPKYTLKVIWLRQDKTKPPASSPPPSSNAPTALYEHYDAAGALLYIGISVTPFARLKAHMSASHWSLRIARVKVRWFPDRATAEAKERDAIRRRRPLHNVIHNRGAP